MSGCVGPQPAHSRAPCQCGLTLGTTELLSGDVRIEEVKQTVRSTFADRSTIALHMIELYKCLPAAEPNMSTASAPSLAAATGAEPVQSSLQPYRHKTKPL